MKSGRKKRWKEGRKKGRMKELNHRPYTVKYGQHRSMRFKCHKKERKEGRNKRKKIWKEGRKKERMKELNHEQ